MPKPTTPKVITEEMNIHPEWYERAKTIKTPPDLMVFVSELCNDYEHDYVTICHAMVAASIAAAKTVNASPHGGITGFQAGAVMWQFIKHWNYSTNKFGLRIIDYDELCTHSLSTNLKKH